MSAPSSPASGGANESFTSTAQPLGPEITAIIQAEVVKQLAIASQAGKSAKTAKAKESQQTKEVRARVSQAMFPHRTKLSEAQEAGTDVNASVLLEAAEEFTEEDEKKLEEITQIFQDLMSSQVPLLHDPNRQYQGERPKQVAFPDIVSGQPQFMQLQIKFPQSAKLVKLDYLHRQMFATRYASHIQLGNKGELVYVLRHVSDEVAADLYSRVVRNAGKCGTGNAAHWPKCALATDLTIDDFANMPPTDAWELLDFALWTDDTKHLEDTTEAFLSHFLPSGFTFWSGMPTFLSQFIALKKHLTPVLESIQWSTKFTYKATLPKTQRLKGLHHVMQSYFYKINMIWFFDRITALFKVDKDLTAVQYLKEFATSLGIFQAKTAEVAELYEATPAHNARPKQPPASEAPSAAPSYKSKSFKKPTLSGLEDVTPEDTTSEEATVLSDMSNSLATDNPLLNPNQGTEEPMPPALAAMSAPAPKKKQAACDALILYPAGCQRPNCGYSHDPADIKAREIELRNLLNTKINGGTAAAAQPKVLQPLK